ncbi:MAG TPA: FAD-dependent oxidoreductase, partial [Lacipirellulaceae bacterium]|nr:FAD-dependent oxidoreductase [Lacipirellulaceae bacterium]
MAFLRRMWGMALVAVTVLLAPARAEPSGDAAQIHEFEVIIAGGSTAAFAAAIAAAESGARTALIEPTDWVGGQLTSSGVPAIDEAWHTIRDDAGEPVLNVARVARDPRNITPTLLTALQAINDPGDCWVSRFCFCPDRFLVDQLTPLQERVGDRLTVFLDTVVKRVERDPATGRLASLTAIARSPRPGLAARGYDRLPSVDLPDWYSMEPSERFDKRVLEFRGPADHGAVFIDATEWGEVLALADVPYLQGVETSDGGADGDDSCGQATVYCFVQQMHAAPTDDPAPPAEVE